jgi:N-acetylmuramoyl-L-alanine amidase
MPFFFLILLTAFLTPAEGTFVASDYLSVVPQQGDGILSLLRRYDLEKYRCNLDKFCSLNKVTLKDNLVKGKKYFLPIELRVYDGQKIRSSLGIKDYDQALGIQVYNEIMLKKGLKAKSFKLDKVIWVPHHALHCPTAEPKPALSTSQAGKPPISENERVDPDFQTASNPAKRKFPIFGEAYAYTPLLSNNLKGRVYYIDAGHGGIDPGAIGRYGGHDLCEDEYAYDVSLRLCRKLIEHGATTYMITRDPNDGIRGGTILKCDKDEEVWGGQPIKTGHVPRLYQRSNIINQLYEQNRKAGITQQLAISIHIDSRGRGQQVDLFLYYQRSNAQSQRLAQTLHNSIRSKYQIYRKNGKYSGTVSTRDLHMLRECKPTAIFMELGNIRHPLDQQRIVLESNREALAKWLYEGLAQQ